MASAVTAAPRRLTTPRVTWRALVPGGVLVLAAWVLVAMPTDHAAAAGFTRMWAAMTVAMMLPTTMRPMLRAANGSPARAWSFAAGFVVVWAMAGIPAYLLMNAIVWTPFWIAMTWLVAGVYQVTPVMQRQLRACRSVQYRGNALTYGLKQGVRCVASCGPLMIAVMVTAMALPGTVPPLMALVAVTVLLCWQNQPSVAPRAIAAVGLAMLVLAAGTYVVLGGGGSTTHHSTGTSTS